MDLIVITVNKMLIRKKVTKYLKDIQLGDFLISYSSGASIFRNEITTRRIDSPFDSSSGYMQEGKTMFVLNTSPYETCEVIDTIYDIIKVGGVNTGIAFSVPISPLNYAKSVEE